MPQGPPQPPPPPPPKVVKKSDTVVRGWWGWTARIVTCCIPNWFIKSCLRKPNALMQQAWREKLTLVYIILLACSALAFLTVGLQRVLCPVVRLSYPYSQVVDGHRDKVYRENVTIYGSIYPFSVAQSFFSSNGLNLTKDYQNTDLSGMFNADTNGACQKYDAGHTPNTLGGCRTDDPYGGWIQKPDNSCLALADLQKIYQSAASLSYDWEDLQPNGVDNLAQSPLLIYGDSVLNISKYLSANTQFFGSAGDLILKNGRGNDASYSLMNNPQTKDAIQCLLARYQAGVISTENGGCIAANIIMNVMIAVIIAVVIIRYLMALIFQWFIAGSLVKPGGRSGFLSWRSKAGGNDDPANHVRAPTNIYGSSTMQSSSSSVNSSRDNSPTASPSLSAVDLKPNVDIVTTKLYTILQVTCYSEGEESMRTTMDSLANTTYSNKHKVFMVIADGLITGSGESRSTPDIVIDMMDLDPTMPEPKACSYLAIADGEKQLNMAKVYAGHYKGVACLVIVKCGTPAEAKLPKPGNRGKRDSQMILMAFFQRVLFNDRLSELDYEIFWKMTWLTKGVTPDKFETVLMVDADTKVLPDALTYMVAAMVNDITIMGLCGETRIANKRTSWVTAIQVFEYYISHHYAKAFESLFGGVTCLPGCFSMYRIKAPKNGSWVPILANPDIVLEYNENVVTTLHEKNLLLLGEDRFLSTLMLRTFPKRQMMFVPQARCKTIVPDTFSVLLSQRRRWINSTVHNLMELVLVSDLCGIACLSMQFSVFIDLIGTIVLPAAIILTVYVIISVALAENRNWQPIILLACIIGLPAVLIVLTTRKFVYILWMIVYLIALPIWNLVLPAYSFWRFDDFSWGATRVVEGEKKDKGHGDADGKFDSSQLVMKKWEEWEADRTGRK
ncbi:chitin synthase, partial [Umbelopsis sp. AD052]